MLRTTRPLCSLWQRGVVLLAVAMLLSGCSMVRLGYSQLDHIAAWTADDYFDLNGQQKDEFSRRFDRFYEWHRYEQLPDYATFLGETRGRVEKGLDREDVLWFVEGLKLRYRAIVARGGDDAAALLMTITPAQLDAARRQWDKDNRRYIREYKLDGSPEDIRRARVRRTLDQVEDWVGRLTHEQETRITAMVDALPMTERLRHEDRLRRQREFIELMATRGDRTAFAARLKRWLVDWEQGRAPEYVRQFNAWFDQRVQMVVEIDRMLTPRQRAHASRRLQHYADDFTRLAERPRQQAVAQ